MSREKQPFERPSRGIRAGPKYHSPCHDSIHSLYTFDPNNILLEFSVPLCRRGYPREAENAGQKF